MVSNIDFGDQEIFRSFVYCVDARYKCGISQGCSYVCFFGLFVNGNELLDYSTGNSLTC
jgi:hypothetical protein